MALDFKKLGEVGTVDKVLDTDTVLVERGGSIYRVAGNQLGGAGGYLFEPAEGEATMEEDAGLVITTPCADVFAAIRAGTPITLVMDAAVIGDSYAEFGIVYMPVVCAAFVDGATVGLTDEVAAGFAICFGAPLPISFTNGQPMPASEASATALRMRKGASDGKS